MPRRNRPAHRAPNRNRSRRAILERRFEEDRLEEDERARVHRAPALKVAGSPDRIRCVKGKTGFRTEAAAQARLEEIRARDEQGRRKLPIRVYQCGAFSYWHLTSEERRGVDEVGS